MRKFNLREPLSKIQVLQNSPWPNQPTKRNLKIYTQKLPIDFFSGSRNREYPSEPSTARSKLKMYSNTEKLPEFGTKDEKSSEVCKTAASSRVLVHSEDQLKDNDEELIAGLINSARNIKRMIRKHSLEIRKDSQHKNNNEAIELPPLNLKMNKGRVPPFAF